MYGREVDNLAEGTINAGDHMYVFDSKALPQGVYFCKLESENSQKL